MSSCHLRVGRRIRMLVTVVLPCLVISGFLLSTLLSSLISPPSFPVSSAEILLVLKTGSTEIHKKLPVHLETTLTVARQLMIFSDAAQDFYGHPIRDALKEVSMESWKSSPEDYQTYLQIREASSKDDSQALAALNGSKAWNLDRWKFIPMLRRATDALLASKTLQWLVLIEADTAVSWPNLLDWLSHKNSGEPLYLGSSILYGGKSFAHGGSGIVISRKAAEKLQQSRRHKYKDQHDYDLAWEKRTSETPYGDLTLGLAMQKAGVPVTQTWPMTQGESLSSIDWSTRMWCERSIFWHHIDDDEIRRLWEFEASLQPKPKGPTRFRDVFTHLVQPYVRDNQTNWKNYSDGRELALPLTKGASSEERLSIMSSGGCAGACVAEKSFKCMQWMFTPGHCHLGKSIVLGRPTQSNEQEVWHSGWLHDRIADSIVGKRGCAGPE